MRIDPILPLNNPGIQTCNNEIYIFNIRITIWMLETCIDINTEISEVDNYTWIFISRIFRLALKTTFLLNKDFFLQMAW